LLYAREENACRETITSNCYCYAVNKVGWNGGYCMPGYRKEGGDVDFASCRYAVRKVELDGAVPVSKKQVYSAEPPLGQHYIAMVLWPGEVLLQLLIQRSCRAAKCDAEPATQMWCLGNTYTAYA
jgi:hypothetical protein